MEILLPDGTSKKYGRLVMGLVVLLYVVQSIGHLAAGTGYLRVPLGHEATAGDFEWQFVRQKQWQVEEMAKSLPGVSWARAEVSLGGWDPGSSPAIHSVRVVAGLKGEVDRDQDKGTILEAIKHGVQSLLAVDERQIDVTLR